MLSAALVGPACSSFGDDEVGPADGDSGTSQADATSTQDGQAVDGGTEGGDGGPVTSPFCPTNVQGPKLVFVEGVCIDETEVTTAQYAAYWSARKNEVRSDACANVEATDPSTMGACQGRPGNYPVGCVNWCDAEAYCAWAGKRLCKAMGGDDLSWALRGEWGAAEWVHACTAGGKQTFPTGAFWDGDAGCNVIGASANGPVAADIGCEGPNGVKHLAGNVGEWIGTCTTSMEGVTCGVSGETWKFRSANASPGDCTAKDEDPRDGRYDDLGFRCCANVLDVTDP
jgi:formylglycine-generating enzyme required for sulfatase activity